MTPDSKPPRRAGRRIALIVAVVAAFWLAAGYLLWDSALGIRARAMFGIESACAAQLSPAVTLQPPFRPMRNPSSSMEPTLPRDSTMSVAAVPANWTPKRGQLIVFKVKGDPAQLFVKRIVGLPGDKIRISHERLFINGTEIPATDGRAYPENMPLTRCMILTQQLDDIRFRILDCGEPHPRAPTDYTVPADHLFVLGDNRDNSADSRVATVGMVAIGNVTGLPHCLERQK